MTSAEIVKALQHCATVDGSGCYECPAKSEFDCEVLMKAEAADLIERLEKEKAALIDAANPRKLCDICKNDSFCFGARCNGNNCDDCWQYRNCPCADCLSHPKFEWKGLETAL